MTFDHHGQVIQIFYSPAFSMSIVVRPVVVVLVATVDLSSTWSNFCGDVAVTEEGGGTSSGAV